MRRALGACAVLLSACSFTFDDSAPLVRLVGGPPPTGGLQSIEMSASSVWRFVDGADGVPWLAIYDQTDLGIDGAVRMERLADPPAVEMFRGEHLQIGKSAIYIVQRGTDGDDQTRVLIRRPGDGGQARQISLPGTTGTLTVSDGGEVVMWTGGNPDGGGLDLLVRTDGSFRREVAASLPPGIVTAPPIFDRHAERLFTFGLDGRVSSHATRSDEDRLLAPYLVAERVLGPDYGAVVSAVALDEQRAQLIVCGQTGLFTVPFDGSEGRTLDPGYCNAVFTVDGGQPRFEPRDGQIIYTSTRSTRVVALDGGSPPRDLFEAYYTLDTSLTHGAFATVPLGVWGQNATDGWVDAWQFMERGRLARFSRDGTRLRWLEHAADSDGIGDLESARLFGAARPLIKNVFRYDELPDGRLIAAANHWEVGVHNRVIVVDEDSRTARWVADGASRYTLIPGTNDVLVERVTMGESHEYLRCPIPPRGTP